MGEQRLAYYQKSYLNISHSHRTRDKICIQKEYIFFNIHVIKLMLLTQRNSCIVYRKPRCVKRWTNYIRSAALPSTYAPHLHRINHCRLMTKQNAYNSSRFRYV